MVQVKITRAESGATQIDITAEKSSTLMTLQRDQMQLHRTLDDAGVSTIGRTITFHAAPATQAASGDAGMSFGGTGFGGSPAGGQQGQASRTNTGTADSDGSAGGDKSGFSGRESNGYASGRRPMVSPEIAARTGGGSYRTGLDITA